MVLCHQGTTMVLVLAQAGMPGQYPGVAWPVQVRVASIVIWGPGGHPQAGSLGTAVCVFCKRTGDCGFACVCLRAREAPVVRMASWIDPGDLLIDRRVRREDRLGISGARPVGTSTREPQSSASSLTSG